jgi:hypothetical protein
MAHQKPDIEVKVVVFCFMQTTLYFIMCNKQCNDLKFRDYELHFEFNNNFYIVYMKLPVTSHHFEIYLIIIIRNKTSFVLSIYNFVTVFYSLFIFPQAGPDIKYLLGFIRTQLSTSVTVGLVFGPKVSILTQCMYTFPIRN